MSPMIMLRYLNTVDSFLKIMFQKKMEQGIYTLTAGEITKILRRKKVRLTKKIRQDIWDWECHITSTKCIY